MAACAESIGIHSCGPLVLTGMSWSAAGSLPCLAAAGLVSWLIAALHLDPGQCRRMTDRWMAGTGWLTAGWLAAGWLTGAWLTAGWLAAGWLAAGWLAGAWLPTGSGTARPAAADLRTTECGHCDQRPDGVVRRGLRHRCASAGPGRGCRGSSAGADQRDGCAGKHE